MTQVFQTRIGKIIQTQKIQSLTGARDIGGAIVTRSGRTVISVGASDFGKNFPCKIVVIDDGGKTVREVFSMPAVEDVSYHTVGLTYDNKSDVIVAMFGREKGGKGRIAPWSIRCHPFSVDNFGDGDDVVVLGRDNGETWHIDKEVRLDKPQKAHGISGCGVQSGKDIFFPRPCQTSNPEQERMRHAVTLAKLRIMPKSDGSFTCDYQPEFRTLSTNRDEDIRYSDETIYMNKLDGSGFMSFTRNAQGPPYRREYDLNHNPTCEFERCHALGFDRRGYNLGHNGPATLVAFNVARLADGNLMYAGRFYGTEHHQGGEIFMTSRDEGKTWLFDKDYLPWTLDPLEFSNSGAGGNPQMYYAPDGKLMHYASEGLCEVRFAKKGVEVEYSSGDYDALLLDPPPSGGVCLCYFDGFVIEGSKINTDGEGTLSVDVSQIAKLDDVYISRISIEESQGVKLADDDGSHHPYKFSADRTKVCFGYKMKDSAGFIRPKIVLANRSNPYHPIFKPRINVG